MKQGLIGFAVAVAAVVVGIMVAPKVAALVNRAS